MGKKFYKKFDYGAVTEQQQFNTEQQQFTTIQERMGLHYQLQ